MAFQHSTSAIEATMDSNHPSSPSSLARLRSAFGDRRARKQASLFFAGATFFFLSGVVTRRALHRRFLAARPRTFTPSNDTTIPFNGPLEAAQALGIATLNVSTFAMMVTGGALWAFDISSLSDLRRKVRGGLGVDGTGRGEQEVEEDFEEWIATVLNRKEMKEELKGKGKDRAAENDKDGKR